ncbi:short chain type dehydrogenase [Aspergillus flavus]|nr:short chain type dehydrogenase [Aspergillus flavus]
MAPMALKTKTHSCLTCRRRKVRCTRQQPCMYCTRTGRQCIFPETTKTRQRKPTAREEFRNRLERLECMVKDIITNREYLNEMENDSQATDVATVPTEASSQGSDTTLPTIHESGNYLPSCRLDERSTHESTLSLDQPNQGSIPSSRNNPLPSPRDSLQIDCWTFEGRAFPLQTPRISYPFLDLAPALWHIYADSVAPLFPLLHKPSARNLLLLGIGSKQSMTQNKKALILSILFVTVVSMSPAKCCMVLKESRDNVARYLKNEVKQALSDARFLTTTSLTCMQALVLFLIGLYAEKEQHAFRSMTALVLRRAKGMNLHRDGTHFGLTPFRAEMRRRLWWMICLLDVYSCEDHAREPIINEEMYDVRLPLNVNDDDLFP